MGAAADAMPGDAAVDGGIERHRATLSGDVDIPAGSPADSPAADTGERRPARPLGQRIRSAAYKALDVAAMMVGLGLLSAMLVARRGVGETGQWAVGILAMLATLLSQTVFADEIGSIVDEAKAKADEERRQQAEELAEGDYDGVPRIVQEMLPYPTEEDARRIAAERDRQRQLMAEWKACLRGKGPLPGTQPPGGGAGGEDGCGAATENDNNVDADVDAGPTDGDAGRDGAT